MKGIILLLASKMLSMSSDEFSNHGCNDLDEEIITLLKSTVNEEELCSKIRKWNGDDEWPQSFEQIGDSSLMHFLADEMKTLSDLYCR